MNALKHLLHARPMRWRPAEMFVMRLLFALLVFGLGEAARETPWLNQARVLRDLPAGGIEWDIPASAAEMRKPNGIAKIIPFGWMANDSVLRTGKIVVACGLALYVAGLFPVLTLFPAVLFMTGTGALRNSQGDISHHMQLVAMVLLAQWLTYVVMAARRRGWLRPPAAVQERVIFWSLLTIGAGYTASGLEKLDASDGRWIAEVPALSVQVIKAVSSAAYSSGEPVSGFKAVTVPKLIIDHPNLSRVFFGAGLALELLGFLMVVSKRHAFWVALSLLLMHLGISMVMEIDFWNHVAVLFIFAVNVPGLFLKPPSDGETAASPSAGADGALPAA